MKRIVVSSIIALFLLIQGCSSSDSDTLYKNCIKVGMVEQMEGMEESDRKSVEAGVELGCELIVEECEKQPEGEMCKAIQQKFNSTQ